MTAARQQRKRGQAHVAAAAVLSLALAAFAALPGAASERIVVDWHTGLAIDGYDPVAFYTEGKPAPGSAELELSHDGAVWRFCNLGNREAFAANPEVYMPRFGGYDPVGVARGVAVAGNPNLWLIAGNRLFLFHDRDHLNAFAADPERGAAAAERKWPDVERKLSP
jgi:YHS domain-containing protein